MAIIDFRSTSYLKAFILYSLVTAISASLAIEIRLAFEDKDSQLFKFINPLTAETGISKLHICLATVLITFLASIIIYNLMYLIFGWGGGMIVREHKRYGKYLD